MPCKYPFTLEFSSTGDHEPGYQYHVVKICDTIFEALKKTVDVLMDREPNTLNVSYNLLSDLTTKFVNASESMRHMEVSGDITLYICFY